MSTLLSSHSTSAPMAQFVLQYRPGRGRRGLGCWLAVPRDVRPEASPLVAVHGIQRGAREQAALFASRAAMTGRAVIAPIFDENTWPLYQQVVRKGRADIALLALIDELRLAGICRTRRFDLAGFSGGAQFAHRFAMLYPHLISRLSVTSAGWYTFPDAAAFPYGLSARPGRRDDWGPHLAAGLQQFLRLPIQVCVGAEDNLLDSNTRNGPEIDRQQGKDRVTRARRWAAALRGAASQRGITPRVGLTVLPNCGHDFRACVLRGGLDRWVLPSRASSVMGQSQDPEITGAVAVNA